MTDYEVFLRMLREQFPDRMMIGTDDTAKIFGVKKKTLYNELSKGTFPVRPAAYGRFKITDIARALCAIGEDQ